MKHPHCLAWICLTSVALLGACADDGAPPEGDGSSSGSSTTSATTSTTFTTEITTTSDTTTAGTTDATTTTDGGSTGQPDEPLDPATAPRVAVDRFSEDAGTLFVRDGQNALPEADAPIDFDMAPFITTGLGPAGETIQYYNFDVQPTAPIPIWVLVRDGESTPVEGQLNIIDSIPGDAGYNDFWSVVLVTVPSDYVANTVTSYDEIVERGYDTMSTDMLVNCPVVPEDSTATLRLGTEGAGLHMGWYQDQVVHYFQFSEADLVNAGGVPLSPIYVTFEINPDEPGGGPASGFLTEMNSDQTHNVTATLPEDANYSPLWEVNIYDNADFDSVSDLTTAQAATQLAAGAATVNCPVVSIE
jgi:hypothetical protein